jgi:hypothetical protein
MTQVQEGEPEEAKKPDYSLALWIIKHIFIVMGIAIVLAIVGVALGAVNYMSGPVHYAAWLLAAWMVVDILLFVFLLLHLVLYGIVSADSRSDWEVLLGLLGIVMLIAAGAMLSGKHLAWLSMCELLFLVAATVIDILIVIQQA